MKTTIPYHVKGKQRTKLAEEVGNILKVIPKYLGVPTCAYQIGNCTLDREGTLHIPDSVEDNVVAQLLGKLQELGFEESADERLVITMPKESFTDAAIANLEKMVENKKSLMERAFLGKIELIMEDTTIKFPWFPYTTESDEVNAYTEFVGKLCEKARKTKRIIGMPTETDNDKYTFRCFLLRLGFIGEEYKKSRKILLRNLTGNSAFRNGKK